jgi:exopolysaccharide biosynthesis polyprenyl glycosylphosphotransferase
MYRQATLRLVLFVGDLATLTVAMVAASWLRAELPFGAAIDESAAWLSPQVYALVLLCWALGFALLDVYNLRKNFKLTDELGRLAIAHLVTALAFSGALYFSFRDTSRLQILYFAGLGLVSLVGFRVLCRMFWRTYMADRGGVRRVLIVGAGPVGRDVAQAVLAHHWTGLRLVGFADDDPDANTAGLQAMGTLVGFPNFGPIGKAVEIARANRIDEVIVALPGRAHEQLEALVTALQELSISIRVVPDLLGLAFARSTTEEFGGMPLITLREPVLDPLQRFIKRVFDVSVSSLVLVAALPLMLLVALAIRIDSRGPALFPQQRVGQNGRLFEMYKFRSMAVDAEARQAEVDTRTADGRIVHKIPNDPRVTRVGAWIRRFSIDELPQLINVLKGDMSLVGPRPELPRLVEQYEPWQRKRFEVPQGITGWWQVTGRADNLMHLNTQADLDYIRNYSIWLDLKILWKTVRAVLGREGAF